MRFSLNKALLDEILFSLENKEGVFVLDTQKSKIVSAEEYDEDEERYIALPQWTTNDGFRLMEKFASGLSNPLVRQELNDALNQSKGVFRSFKNVLERYPETEKSWVQFKNMKIKNHIVSWYNSLKTEWAVEGVGGEPDETSTLILEDFVLRDGNEGDKEKALALHKICLEERESMVSEQYEKLNPFVFPGDFCLVTENFDDELTGYICAVKDSSSQVRICQLEVRQQYRGMGIGKTLLAKLLKKINNQELVSIDLPAGMEHFSRGLKFEDFEPCVQRFVRKDNKT